MRTAIVAFLVLAAAGQAVAQEDMSLKVAPGHETVESNCAACHTLDYIRMNSPFMTPEVWRAEVTKMIKTYGAPIDDADAKTITDYLVQNYGGPAVATSPEKAKLGR